MFRSATEPANKFTRTIGSSYADSPPPPLVIYMASAVFASQNESGWAHMGKIQYSNPHLNPNPNPNPNPKKKQKQFHHAAANGVAGRYHHHNNNVDSPIVVTQAASDDAYSFNQTSTSRNAVDYGGYLTFNVASYTKSELVELRKRLSSELDQIRDLRDRVESGQLMSIDNSRSKTKFKKLTGKKPGVAAVGSIAKNLSNGFDTGSSVAINFEASLKECSKVVAKLIKHKFGYVFRAPVDAVALGLHDYHLIVKRPMDLGTVKSNLAKNLYNTPMEFAADVRLTFNNALLYNPKTDRVNHMAEELLARFEELYRPIQEKIDSCLSQQREKEFRESRVNEELQFRAVEEVQGSSWNNRSNQILGSPLRGKKDKPKVSPIPAPQAIKKPDRMQAHSSASTPSHHPPPSMNQQPLIQEQLPPSPVRAPTLPVKEPKVGRAVGIVKQPKPRAKDPNKREMNMEEKQMLGIGLQSLPQEKMPQLVQIIRKRNEHLAQDGDEIELDIEALDTETLWELDRFVTNWKKLVSKTKRQALIMNNPAFGVAGPTNPAAEADMGAMSDNNDDDSGKRSKDNDEEDVDIDDDLPVTSFPPVEIEKDEGNVGGGGGGGGGQDHDHNDQGNNASSSSSSSGSSSSDSSSSSGIDTDSSCVSTLAIFISLRFHFTDSDSGSSSGSDSDADDAQS
ncbi:hypothetical protein BUALT_Bualt15G0053700 [Buddleja alternifolia]|uniref:Uncharacterized protein n=1 Tax=Buddleja alternifolia TaxID=168488 RepID=A0AAV6WNE4_9LAMI|nr:hypothetical protein BUALT_Bualt15G0053700 [Buddleja alternifolia]